MGKIADDRAQLDDLLNGVSKSTLKVEVDDVEDIPEVVKRKPGRPKKGVQTEMFCGMDVPLPIFNICMNLIESLKAQGKYTSNMDYMIFNAAVQQYVYNDLITQKISQTATIPTRSLTTASESFRRALQSLGLTVVDKKSGLKPEDDAANNPLSVFLNNMQQEQQTDEVITKKKKGTK